MGKQRRLTEAGEGGDDPPFHFSGWCPLVCCMQGGRGTGNRGLWGNYVSTCHKVRHQDGEMYPGSLRIPLPLRRNRRLPLAVPGPGFITNLALLGMSLAARTPEQTRLRQQWLHLSSEAGGRRFCGGFMAL